MSTGLLGFAEVEERKGGGIDSYVSPSRLNAWLSCPLKWYFAYVEGIRQPTSPSLFLGRVVHAGLETFYRHRQLGITLEAGDVMRRTLEGWAQTVDEENMLFADVAEEEALQKQAGDLVTAYVRQIPEDEGNPLAVEVACEAPLIDPVTCEDLGVPMVGVIDLVLDEPEGPLVCDFKTAARGGDLLETAHEVQLSSYAYLFRHSQGQDESGLEIRSLVKTKTPRIELHRYSPRREAHFRRLFSVLREYIDALDTRRWNYRPGFGCSMCDYRAQCQRWEG